MTFIAAPTANFNSFATVSFADAYHLDRGNAAWDTLDTNVKEGILVRVSDFITANYTLTVEPIVEDTVNPVLLSATAQLALYAITVDLNPVRDAHTVLSETLGAGGGVSVSTSYDKTTQDRFPFVTAMLSGIAKRNSAGGVESGRLIL